MPDVTFKRMSVGAAPPRLGFFQLDLSGVTEYPDGGVTFAVKPGGEISALIAVGSIDLGAPTHTPIHADVDPKSGKLRLFQHANGVEYPVGTDLSSAPVLTFLVLM